MFRPWLPLPCSHIQQAAPSGIHSEGKGLKALGVFVWQRDPAPGATASMVHLQESHPFCFLLSLQGHVQDISQPKFGFLRWKITGFNLSFYLSLLDFTWNAFIWCFYSTDTQKMEQKVGRKKLSGIWSKSPLWKLRTRSAVLLTAVKDIRWMHLMENCFHSAIQQSESNVNKNSNSENNFPHNVWCAHLYKCVCVLTLCICLTHQYFFSYCLSAAY